MSRSYKSNPGYQRQVRGHKRAVMQGCKGRKVPADNWYTEKNFCQWDLGKRINALSKKGWSYERIVKHLTKFLGYKEWAVRLTYGFWDENDYSLPYPYYDNGKDKVRNRRVAESADARTLKVLSQKE